MADAAHHDSYLVHCREAIRFIVAGIFIVANANQRRLRQLDRGREHLLARQTPLAQMTSGSATNLGQRFRERDNAFVLVLVLGVAPPRVIAILLAAARVTAGGLQVSVRYRADPDVLSRRRNRHRLNPCERRWIAERLAPRRTYLNDLPRRRRANPRSASLTYRRWADRAAARNSRSVSSAARVSGCRLIASRRPVLST
jgi:hypothetical protein